MPLFEMPTVPLTNSGPEDLLPAKKDQSQKEYRKSKHKKPETLVHPVRSHPLVCKVKNFAVILEEAIVVKVSRSASTPPTAGRDNDLVIILSSLEKSSMASTGRAREKNLPEPC